MLASGTLHYDAYLGLYWFTSGRGKIIEVKKIKLFANTLTCDTLRSCTRMYYFGFEPVSRMQERGI